MACCGGPAISPNGKFPDEGERQGRRNISGMIGHLRYGPDMELPIIGSGLVPMDKHTFMWVQLTHFSFDSSLNDRSLLARLIASPGYAHDYASPFDSTASVIEPALHGRWFRDHIHPSLFEPCSAADAEALIQSWADDQDWTDPGYRQPSEVHARLARVYALLRAGNVYMLRNPDEDAEHEYGWVTGAGGFHEFVVIDRVSQRLHVVVASDD